MLRNSQPRRPLPTVIKSGEDPWREAHCAMETGTGVPLPARLLKARPATGSHSTPRHKLRERRSPTAWDGTGGGSTRGAPASGVSCLEPSSTVHWPSGTTNERKPRSLEPWGEPGANLGPREEKLKSRGSRRSLVDCTIKSPPWPLEKKLLFDPIKQSNLLE